MKNVASEYSAEHTYVVCAYKESAYLEKCIISLKNQSVKSNIIMVTSTPNEYISSFAQKYKIDLFINKGDSGIVQDWNFGYNKCKTPYVTIAHQDDIYFEDYTKQALDYLRENKNPLIYFSDYCEIRNDCNVNSNTLLKVKRILLFPLRFKCFQKSVFVRRRSLSLGNGICCPAVTFAVKNLPNPVFNVHFRSCEDWEAWEKLSKLKGAFLYNHSIQMGHRIHEESETSIIIGDSARKVEDYEMFCKFWPQWIAKIIVKFYSKSEKSNKV